MIIVAAIIALVQIFSMRSGTLGPIGFVGTTIASIFETGISAVVDTARGGATSLIDLPHLASDNRSLRARDQSLAQENARLQELLAAYKQEASLQPLRAAYANAIIARVIGFPPQNESRSVTIDRGSRDGVRKDDGVLSAGGVVGIVQEVGLISSKVVLITDYTSRLPAVVRRGRWWGIARGNLTSVRMEYVSQDAPLRVGDVIVTGEARSFHSGGVIGTVIAIERGDANLYQTAIVKPAIDLGALDRVVVVPK